MFAFVKERSDKNEDDADWVALRALVLKVSTRIELGFSIGLHIRLYGSVQLFVVPSCFAEYAPYEGRNRAYALARLLVPISS